MGREVHLSLVSANGAQSEKKKMSTNVLCGAVDASSTHPLVFHLPHEEKGSESDVNEASRRELFLSSIR